MCSKYSDYLFYLQVMIHYATVKSALSLLQAYANWHSVATRDQSSLYLKPLITEP